jgi:hypothetical protein
MSTTTKTSDLKSRKLRKAALDFIRFLGIEKIPDQSRRGSPKRTHGLKTSLGIQAFWTTLFEANEMLDQTKKMTDTAIEAAVLNEFPTEAIAKNLIEHKTTVNWHRNAYNEGRYTKGEIPERFSFRYNYDGKPVNGKTGRRELDPAEIKKLKADHRALRKAWKKEQKK